MSVFIKESSILFIMKFKLIVFILYRLGTIFGLTSNI